MLNADIYQVSVSKLYYDVSWSGTAYASGIVWDTAVGALLLDYKWDH